jgi:hypothetical protein
MYYMYNKFSCSHKFNIYLQHQVIQQKIHNIWQEEREGLDHSLRTIYSKSGHL